MGLLSWLTEGMNDLGTNGSPQPPMMPAPPQNDAMTMNGQPVPVRPISREEFNGPPGLQPYPMGTDPMTAGGGPYGTPSPPISGPQDHELPYAAGGDPMTAGGLMPNGPGLPPGIPAPGPAELPPNAAPTGGAGMPPGPPMDIGPPGLGSGINGVGPGLGVGPGAQEAVESYQRAGGNFGPVGGSPQAKTILGRAFGIDPNTEAQLRGTLGAGFKAAGESAGKSPGQAFASGAGAGIDGGKKADDTTTAQQDKYLQRAIQARREGNTAEYQKNYLRYQIEATKARLAIQKEKAASASVVNSPEQLYLRADAQAVREAAALKSQYDKTAQQFGADSKEAKAAMDAYNKGVSTAREAQYGKLGLDPKKAGEIGKQPGMSDQNPVKSFPKDPAGAQKAFDALPEGAYFINPADGRLLRKKAGGGTQASNPAQPQQSAMMPPMAPPMPQDPGTPYPDEAAA
jgi:hypothetical protein